MRDTINQLTQRGHKFTKNELTEVLETNRKKVYKRPMTAVNLQRKRKAGINIFKKDSDDEMPVEVVKNVVKKEQDYKDEELVVKQKITVEDPLPANVVSIFGCKINYNVWGWIGYAKLDFIGEHKYRCICFGN